MRGRGYRIAASAGAWSGCLDHAPPARARRRGRRGRGAPGRPPAVGPEPRVRRDAARALADPAGDRALPRLLPAPHSARELRPGRRVRANRGQRRDRGLPARRARRPAHGPRRAGGRSPVGCLRGGGERAGLSAAATAARRGHALVRALRGARAAAAHPAARSERRPRVRPRGAGRGRHRRRRLPGQADRGDRPGGRGPLHPPGHGGTPPAAATRRGVCSRPRPRRRHPASARGRGLRPPERRVAVPVWNRLVQRAVRARGRPCRHWTTKCRCWR